MSTPQTTWPIVDGLTANLSELASYQVTTLKFCNILLNARDYKSAQEAFDVMCRWLSATHQRLGHDVTPPR